MLDVLNLIIHSSVAVEGGSRELSRKLTLLDVLGKVVEADGRDQVLRQLGLYDPLLDQLIESLKIWVPPALGVALCVHEVVLEGDNLSLELLGKQL